MYIHEWFRLLERDGTNGLIERVKEPIARDKHRVEWDRANIQDRGADLPARKRGRINKRQCCSLCCSAEGEAYAEATHQSAGCARDHAM